MDYINKMYTKTYLNLIIGFAIAMFYFIIGLNNNSFSFKRFYEMEQNFRVI